MSHSEERRFTDEDVALVLRRASELEDQHFRGGGAALSQRQLEEIAAEVGIPRSLVAQAIAGLDAERRFRRAVAGGRLVQRAVRTIPGELDTKITARLIEHVESTSEVPGVISETLGSTRWTATGPYRSTQISITPARGQTTILVVERATARLRGLLFGIPAFGIWLTFGVVVGALHPPSGATAAMAALAAAVGGGAGSLAWRRISGASATRVERLAAELFNEAAGPEH